MLEIIKAILFGIVEGITEWLPISSTGHMILLNEFVKMEVSEEFWDMFLVVIQLGAILAVVLLYFWKIWPFGRKKNGGITLKKDIVSLWCKIIVACIPAAIVGLAFDDLFDALFYNKICVSIALIVFGIAFILIENWNRGKKPAIGSLTRLDYKTVILIGMFQLIAAIFPGTSRSGATIVGALLLGVSRTVAAEFTFFLAIPVMFGASLLKVVKFILSGVAISGMELAILGIGLVVAFVVSIVVIRFLMSYIKKHDFKVFGWYRIILGLLVLLILR
ncbi:MAG: undecaprenyl-diphosphate phosphatase [Lachnospiraceae bacterium]|nr:undecaprenyl-diphosphate phosphatase [Lachnospiraceae bacterium]